MRGHIRTRARRTRRNITRLLVVTGFVAASVVGTLALAAFTSVPTIQTVAQPTASPGAAKQLSAGGPTIRLVKKDGSPITQADVIKYVQTSGMPRVLTQAQSVKVTRAELLTSSEISVLLHGEPTGYPDDAMLWFVEMNGTFVFPANLGQTITSHVGYQVFDPITGNLVMYGGMG